MPSLVEDLLGSLAGSELVETHISWVFLHEKEVFKVKKPVSLGFLDFSTPELRRAACEAEVRLNRRLAPSVYLGLLPVVLDVEGRHAIVRVDDGEGTSSTAEAVDWAVHMVRLDDEARADHRLATDQLGFDHVEGLAEQLAAFHREARCDEETTRFGEVERIAVNVVENFEQTRESLERYLEPSQAEEVEAWQRRFLDQRRELFASRRAEGRVRDGHGDLRLEHVYFDRPEGEGPSATIVDCIEFNERFRFADVCADIAFLSMDLAWHGRVDLAEAFLAAYALHADDYDLYPLVDFYESYRAFVRGKIAALMSAEAEARRYFLLALAAERRSLLPPAVVAVGGLIATGKSTVARQLARELGAPVVEADRTRKYLLGVAPREKVHVPAWQGPYSPERTGEVYSELVRRAGKVLDSGRRVVIDASFRSRELRALARELALERRVPFAFVECQADIETCRRRLERRAEEGGVSDGRLEIFEDFAASWEDAGEIPDGERLTIDTTHPLEANLPELRRFLGTWPVGLTS